MKEKKEETCIKNEIIFLAPAIICFSCIVLDSFHIQLCYITNKVEWNI